MHVFVGCSMPVHDKVRFLYAPKVLYFFGLLELGPKTKKKKDLGPFIFFSFFFAIVRALALFGLRNQLEAT